MVFAHHVRGYHAVARAAACAAALAAWSPRAISQPLPACIPHDCVAAFLFEPAPRDSERQRQPSFLRTAPAILDQVQTMGLLRDADISLRVALDVIAAVAEVVEFPWTLVLLDIEASERENGGHRLSRIHAALVVRTDGAHETFERRIQSLLDRYANQQESALEVEEVEGDKRYSLHDRRLPSWAGLRWGRIGDWFVAAIGEGSFERVAAAVREPTAARNALEADFRASWDNRPDRFAALYLDMDRLLRGADSRLAAKIGRARNAIGLKDATHAAWTIHGKDRAVEVLGSVRRGEIVERTILAGSQFRGVDRPPWVPRRAEFFTLIDVNPRAVLHGLSEAYLASRSPDGQDRVKNFWRRLQESSGVSIENDLIGRLAPPIVIHDHPPHAFHLPLWTVQIRIGGDAAALRVGLDRLLEHIQSELVRPGGWSLQHEPDGVWFVQYGLAGPALSHNDQWMVLGFSPAAVRQVLGDLALPAVIEPKASGR
jgi:hypothetical protein